MNKTVQIMMVVGDDGKIKLNRICGDKNGEHTEPITVPHDDMMDHSEKITSWIQKVADNA